MLGFAAVEYPEDLYWPLEIPTFSFVRQCVFAALETDILQGTMFLKAHPCLEHLAFFWSLSGYSDGVSSLQLMSLPQLQVFTGKINQLEEISTPHLPSL
jgi:hypothetical protein